ncbi:hypothetical protein [Niabella drilacis]|uniref:Uncharacterized protein n=1 Tax=Niabella drilacis (strain DSM 25811 / CCM 8410 / CCUG 62505 / LMG 26954 / E90) TaxID=1285928 RepID=A0A1G6SPA5_NIADE|nr:hypothetical protein [Niabella drilacis]SDD17946.1 hypothetical protein SAMN04487894_106283 [Niabella drilacis]
MGKVIKCKFDRTTVASSPFLDHLLKGEVKRGDTISVKDGSKMKFYVDAGCFDDAVVSTETKWAFIYEQYYNSGDSKTYNGLWADIGGAGGGSSTPGQKAPDVGELLAKKESNAPVTALGIGTQYKKGTEFFISPAGTNYYYGFKQRVVVFTGNPEEEFYFFIIPYTDPNITYAYFHKNIRPFRFGDIVNLTICLHQYPDYVTGAGNYRANIYLLDKDKAGGIHYTKDSLEPPDELEDRLKELDLFKKEHKNKALTVSGSSGNINTYLNLTFPLSLDWRDADPGKKQRYFVPVVEIIEVKEGLIRDSRTIVDFRNFAENPSTGLMQYDQKLIGVEAVATYKDQPNSEILVEYETTAEILSRVESEKSEMIQYIGDIQYRNREHNPCAYSVIKVKHKERSLVVFDEYGMGMDGTEDRVFDILAGDASKESVTVTAKFKENAKAKEGPIHVGASYKCDRILNDGMEHKTSKDVFKMGWIVGQWKPSASRNMLDFFSANRFTTSFFAPLNGSKAPLLNAGVYDKTYKNDQEAKGVPKPSGELEKYRPVSVAEVQGLTDQDYEVAGDTLTLKLAYTYDRSIAEGTSMQNPVLDIFWYFKYFWPTEKMAQQYFVPVTTCRYPNQVARIRVFPDIQWEIALTYNYNAPLGFNSGNLSTYDVEAARKKYTEISQQEYDLATEQSALGKFKLGLFNPKINDKDVVKIEAELAERLRKICSIFYKLKKMANVVAYGTESGCDALRRKKVPFTFEIDAPSTGLKIAWGMQPSLVAGKTHKVGMQGSLDWFASPLIGAALTIKLHQLIGYIPHPLAKVIDGVISGINSIKGEHLNLKFEVNLVFEGKLNINIRAFQINSVNTTRENLSTPSEKSYIEGVFTVKLGITLEGKGKVRVPWTRYNFNFGAKAEASLKAYWDAKLKLQTREKGLMGALSGGFSGIKGQIIVEVIVGPATFTVYDKEDTWFKPDDVNPESDVSRDDGQKDILVPLISE